MECGGRSTAAGDLADLNQGSGINYLTVGNLKCFGAVCGLVFVLILLFWCFFPFWGAPEAIS